MIRNFEEEVREAVGDNLTEDQIQELMLKAYGELELAVGEALSYGLSDEQLLEFEALIDAGDDLGASRWLEENRPDYRTVVNNELKVLLHKVERAVRA
ncbi:DUF5663 domain-containing protein [Nocardioides kribbensis]|uniref:DUF5663 domain-containing protein n=1 Tax=Nocardioides kribbensis TaxID=305517 RepID=A0ABV1NTH0_9ACTN